MHLVQAHPAEVNYILQDSGARLLVTTATVGAMVDDLRSASPKSRRS